MVAKGCNDRHPVNCKSWKNVSFIRHDYDDVWMQCKDYVGREQIVVSDEATY